MDLSHEPQQRREFRDILFELAQSQELLEDRHNRANMYKRLEALYDVESGQKRFRHFYSDIFSVLTQIQQNAELGDINILGQNLDMIRSGYTAKNKTSSGRIIDVSEALNKLYDHVNLDIARINYSDAADRKISGESSLEDLQSQINALHDDIQDAKGIKNDCDAAEKRINEVEKKLDKAKSEYITILGIFASIVLAFTGGIAFSTSVLTNIHKASIYRTIIVSVIIGIVLFNIIYALFYYIDRIVNESKQKNFKLLYVFNGIAVVIIIVTVVIWFFGGVEYRNSKIKNNIQQQYPVGNEMIEDMNEVGSPSSINIIE